MSHARRTWRCQPRPWLREKPIGKHFLSTVPRMRESDMCLPPRMDTEVPKHNLWLGWPLPRVQCSPDVAIIKAKQHQDAPHSPGESRALAPTTEETRAHRAHSKDPTRCCSRSPRILHRYTINCPLPQRGPKWPSQEAKLLMPSDTRCSGVKQHVGEGRSIGVATQLSHPGRCRAASGQACHCPCSACSVYSCCSCVAW